MPGINGKMTLANRFHLREETNASMIYTPEHKSSTQNFASYLINLSLIVSHMLWFINITRFAPKQPDQSSPSRHKQRTFSSPSTCRRPIVHAAKHYRCCSSHHQACFDSSFTDCNCWVHDKLASTVLLLPTDKHMMSDRQRGPMSSSTTAGKLHLFSPATMLSTTLFLPKKSHSLLP